MEITPVVLSALVFQLRPGVSDGNVPIAIEPLKPPLPALNSLKLSPEAKVPERLVTFNVPPRVMLVALRTPLVLAVLLISKIAAPCRVALLETLRVPRAPKPAGETVPPRLTVRLVALPVPAIVPLVAAVTELKPSEPLTARMPLLTTVGPVKVWATDAAS